MAVTKKTVGAVLQSGLPATTYVEDFETRRVLESIKTALRLLGNILDGKTDDVSTGISPDVQIEAGQGIKVQNRGNNSFKISSSGDVQASDNERASSITTGVESLIELADVALSGLAAGDTLKYNYALKWINETNRTPFSFVQTGAKAGYFVAGKLRLGGTEITPSGITFGSGGTATITNTNHYMTITLSTGATAWGSGSSFPADSSTTAVIPVAIFTFTGGGDISTYTPLLSDYFVQYGATMPNGSALGQVLHWNASTSRWAVSSVGALSDGDLLRWDSGASQYVKISKDAVPSVAGIASGNMINWDGSKFVVAGSVNNIPSVAGVAVGDIIQWDGSKWVKLTPVTVSVVTNVSYDTVNHNLDQEKKTLTVLVASGASTSTITTATPET